MKRIGLIILILILLFTCASVVASDVNETIIVSDDQSEDLIEIESQDEEISEVNNGKLDSIAADDEGHDKVNNNQYILGSTESKDELSLDNSEENDVLLAGTYPSYSDYSATVSDTVLGEDGGQIYVAVTPAKGFTYYSCFYLKIYKSNSEIFSQLKSCTYSHVGSYISINQGQLSVGTYTIKVINYADKKVMDTATLTVKKAYPSSSAYSVSVSDTSIDYATGGDIKMKISPSSGSTLYYYSFYLKVYDSNNNEKISSIKASTRSYTSDSYRISSKQLSAGTYTIKLINCADNNVMDTAKLTVKKTYPSSSDYSVSVSGTTIDYDVGGSISMKISPASSYNYKYYYYLKVYDSNKNEKISKLFYSTNNDYSKTYNIAPKQLSAGTYTIKLINYVDNNVMGTTTLIINQLPQNSDYTVHISDTCINYEVSAPVIMDILPDSSSLYKYAYYLKIYDSNNNLKISEVFMSTNTIYSEMYTIDANRLSPGTYTMKLLNYYDNVVMDTAKLTVQINTRIIANNINMNYGANKNAVVTLKDSNGNLISGKSLTMNVNGKNYYGVTNKNGQAYINVPKLVPKTYKASIKFAGDGIHIGSSGYVTIVVKPISKVTVKNKVGREGKKIKLTAIVKDGLGTKIKKGTVQFNVKGKTYKAKVKNGKAKVKIKVPVAKKYKTVTKKSGSKRKVTIYYKSVYNCKVTFSGYKQYPSSYSNFKVTSKDKPYSYSYYVAKKKTSSSSSSSKKMSSETYKFNVPHAHAEVDVKVYTGSKYNTYTTQTDWLGNGQVYVTETSRVFHDVLLEVHYYDNGFKKATYEGNSFLLR